MRAIVTVVGPDRVGIIAEVCGLLAKLNINIIDGDKVLAAHENPALYPDLVVRVTGFTAYFSMLSKDFRQLVVDRIIDKRS